MDAVFELLSPKAVAVSLEASAIDLLGSRVALHLLSVHRAFHVCRRRVLEFGMVQILHPLNPDTRLGFRVYSLGFWF